ncbi:Thiamine import ATP-binding protein ThiQ [Marinomonas spartinae]|uniref:Thiamine import ATP-binding protein ThiQ n=1 Tax=Marinomonas spartinae TaxID=1792290 RepID=A0A1A8TA78_9GAMM|nr:ATP-binding cassette domain-containing protein [Marinomonas spartinae]SBS28245.1 Thiamine import ATP-binding protein ThiQ [Marinomonas spartinae]SBS28367.1 Thiamine import ATP-binding protein ThiQ [Marinomonas spartinae]
MLSIDLYYDWDAFHAHYQTSLAPGMTTLLGASGEGKSTLLHLLGGFLQGRGRVSFQGQALEHLLPYERPISTLFQSDNLFPQLTVWQNVAVGIAPSLSLQAEQKAKVSWALKQTQLSDKADQYPQALSGGQAQRVAIARVLVREKPILLLDEPFSALDPALREEMLALVNDVTERFDMTTLLVSHMPSEAVFVGGKVMLIEKGKIMANEEASVLSGGQIPEVFSHYLRMTTAS